MADVLASVTGFPMRDGPPLDLDIHAGEVVRLAGPNGSGKTSLLRALAGLDGPVRPRTAHATRAGLAMQTAMDTLIGLTVEGEFRLRDRPLPSDLHPWAERDVATLSAGEARNVAIAVARDAGPLVLLDEPSEGLDAAAMERLDRVFARVRSDGGAVVVADHGDAWAGLSDRTVPLGPESPGSFAPIAAPSSPTLLHVPGRTRTWGDRTLRLPALRLQAGFHALVGPNGCGKTQTLRHAWETQDGVRMLPAQGRDLLGHATVREELEGLDAWVVKALVPDHCMDRHPWTLSGGEQQRVALAKALGRSTPVVLLDEPEAHLDEAGRDALHLVLVRRVAEGACILAATHDRALIAAATSVVPMEDPA